MPRTQPRGEILVRNHAGPTIKCGYPDFIGRDRGESPRTCALNGAILVADEQ